MNPQKLQERAQSEGLIPEKMQQQVCQVGSLAQQLVKKQKSKRRSKNDQEGRTHKCSLCEKTYLSYPALYTHLKTKHADARGADGQPLTPLPNGRGRGRPKKNIDPLSSEFFKVRPRLGGPSELSVDFPQVYNQVYPFHSKGSAELLQTGIRDYGDFQSHPLWHKLLKLHEDNLKLKYERLKAQVESKSPRKKMEGLEEENKRNKRELEESKDQRKMMVIPKPLATLQSMEDSDSLYEYKDCLQRANCDDLFAVYLSYISFRVNQDYFKHVLRFILLYRECLNDLGWQKKYECIARNRIEEIKMAEAVKGAKSENESELFKKEVNKAMDAYPITGEFCEQCDAEFAPQVGNECVTRYLDESHADVLRDDIIDLTRNFCNWLYVNGFTCTKLVLIQQQNSNPHTPIIHRSSQESFDVTQTFDILQ